MCYTLEICANSFTSAQIAQNGGAHRVELCDNMAEGGTTPSFAQVSLCLSRLKIEVWPILRPRGGDFLYSDDEFELMKIDLLNFKKMGCPGVVTGILLANGKIDKKRNAELMALALPMPLAFHRAIDMTDDVVEALEDIIELGFVRVLSSGTMQNAIEGAGILAQMVKQANGRIEIMPGAGVNASNIAQLAATTQAKTFHSSARTTLISKMEFKNIQSKMGDVDDEFSYQQSDSAKIKAMVDALYTCS